MNVITLIQNNPITLPQCILFLLQINATNT